MCMWRSVCTYVCAGVDTHECMRDQRKYPGLCFLPLRQDLSLNPQLGWQAVRPRNSVSTSHSAGVTGWHVAMSRVFCGCWALEFRSSQSRGKYSYPLGHLLSFDLLILQLPPPQCTACPVLWCWGWNLRHSRQALHQLSYLQAALTLVFVVCFLRLVFLCYWLASSSLCSQASLDITVLWCSYLPGRQNKPLMA